MRRALLILAIAGLAGCASGPPDDYYTHGTYDDTGYYYGGQPYYAAPGDYDYNVDQRYVQTGTYYYPAGWPYYSRPYYYGGRYHRGPGHDGHGDGDHGDHHADGGHDDHHADGGDNPGRPGGSRPGNGSGIVTRPDGSPAAPHGPAGASPNAGSHGSSGSGRGSPHGR